MSRPPMVRRVTSNSGLSLAELRARKLWYCFLVFSPRSQLVFLFERTQIRSLSKMPRNGGLLLILDACETLLSSDPHGFRAFLSSLLSNTRDTKILLTSRVGIGKIPNFAVHLHLLGPLAIPYSLKLFTMMSPRKLTVEELTESSLMFRKPYGVSGPGNLGPGSLSSSSAAASQQMQQQQQLIIPGIPHDRPDLLAQYQVLLSIPVFLSWFSTCCYRSGLLTWIDSHCCVIAIMTLSFFCFQVIERLNGNPHAIGLAASLLEDMSFSELLQFLNSGPPPISLPGLFQFAHYWTLTSLHPIQSN